MVLLLTANCPQASGRILAQCEGPPSQDQREEGLKLHHY